MNIDNSKTYCPQDVQLLALAIQRFILTAFISPVLALLLTMSCIVEFWVSNIGIGYTCTVFNTRK